MQFAAAEGEGGRTVCRGEKRGRCAARRPRLLSRGRWLRCDSLAWPSALATIAAGRFRLLGARPPAEQRAEPDVPQTEPSGPGRWLIHTQHDNVRLWFSRLAACGE